jgi:hypothetical protein
VKIPVAAVSSPAPRSSHQDTVMVYLAAFSSGSLNMLLPSSLIDHCEYDHDSDEECNERYPCKSLLNIKGLRQEDRYHFTSPNDEFAP